MAREKTRITASERTIRIIEGLEEAGDSTVSEVAELTDLPRSTVYYHLQTLKERGFVRKYDGRYGLSLRLLEVGANVRENRQLYRIAKPEIDRLAEETGEMANLMVEEMGKGFHLYRAEVKSQAVTDPVIGQSGLLHCRAIGKAILAYLPEERVHRIIDRYGLPSETGHTITDRDALIEELEQIRERGVAYDDEERLVGVRCVAAPIKNIEGQALGAVSVTGVKERIDDERFRNELTGKVAESSNRIEGNMGYQSSSA